MALNVFGTRSGSTTKALDTSSFVQKPYLRREYIENDTEEAINLKNHFLFKNPTNPISKKQAASKAFVDNLFKDPRIN